jgi:hypothetical protein
MQNLPKDRPGVNNPAGEREREYLMHALRQASARSRLITNTIETVGVSLRHRAVSTDDAMQWLRDEGIIDLIQLGPPSKQGAKS